MSARTMVILGAGPAGSAAAISAAMRGWDAVILEARPFPRFRPGEALHPGTLPLFRTLGVAEEILDAGFLRFPGVWLERDGVRTFQPFRPASKGPGEEWLGFQAWRETLDQILLNRARMLGVRVLQPCRASRLLLDSEGVVRGVTTDQREDILSDWVVDATGTSRWVARQLDLQHRLHSPRQFVEYGYVESNGMSPDGCPVFRINSQQGGTTWTWMAQVRETVAQWARLSIKGDSGKTRKLGSQQPPIEFAGKPVMQPAAVLDATWVTMSRAAGPGYFLTGDAAGTLDPSSAHGVLRALMSGIMAAHLANLNAADPLPAVAARYHDWIETWFASDRAELRRALEGSAV
jgi:flavin-dependent dehydrogenase